MNKRKSAPGMTAPPRPHAATTEFATRHGTIAAFAADHPIATALARYGEWAEAELETLLTFVQAGDIVLDVGAHIGVFTLAFAHKVGARGRVFSFEPQPVLFDLLIRNLSRNDLADRVDAQNCALGSANGYVHLPSIDYSREGNFGAVSPESHIGHPIEDGGIRLQKIDDLSLPACRLIKIDVEGMELEVIEGARETIQRLHPVVCLEAHTIEAAWRKVRALRALSLDTWILATPAYNPKNWKGDPEDFFDLAYECAVLGLREADHHSVASAARLGAILTPVRGLDDIARAYVEVPLPGDTEFERGSPRENLRRVYREKHELMRSFAEKEEQLRQVIEDSASTRKELTLAHDEIQKLEANRGTLVSTLQQTTGELRDALAQCEATRAELGVARAEMESAQGQHTAMSALFDRTREELHGAVQQCDAVRSALAQEKENALAALERHQAEMKAADQRMDHLNSMMALVIADKDDRVLVAQRLAQSAQKLAERPFWNLQNYLIYKIGWFAVRCDFLLPRKSREHLDQVVRKKSPARFLRKLKGRREITDERAPSDLPSSQTLGRTHPSRRNSHEQGDDVMRDIDTAGTFDAQWYVARYPDIKSAGVDPLKHYVYTGWREGRDPADWFSTSYYLTANPDVAAAGVNPLWHYTVAGRREGRQCYHPGGALADILSKLQPLHEQRRLRRASIGPSGMTFLTSQGLVRLLKTAVSNKLLLIALSHDDYRKVSGGVQLCLQIEQRAVEADVKGAFLNLFPRIPSPTLAPTADAGSYELVASLNGQTLGVATADVILSAFERVAVPLNVALVVHSVLGHAPEFVARLFHASRAKTALFWLHDYFAACSGYSLMRNNIKYCAAPPVDSAACQVCIHGSERSAHRERMRKLFEKIPFQFVAPSESARRVWTAAIGHEGSEIHVLPHCSLVDNRQIDRTASPSLEAPARIAYLGHGSHHKGWNTFAKLAREFQHDSRYAFIHLGSQNEFISNVMFEEVSVARDGPDAMIQAVRRHDVDVALTWSLWPETFGFVGYEALAAGAKIVAWEGGGNLAELARTPGVGLALSNEAALRTAFMDGTIHKLAMSRRTMGGILSEVRFSRMSVDVLAQMSKLEMVR